jgi:hypothetical protein
MPARVDRFQGFVYDVLEHAMENGVPSLLLFGTRPKRRRSWDLRALRGCLTAVVVSDVGCVHRASVHSAA